MRAASLQAKRPLSPEIGRLYRTCSYGGKITNWIIYNGIAMRIMADMPLFSGTEQLSTEYLSDDPFLEKPLL